MGTFRMNKAARAHIVSRMVERFFQSRMKEEQALERGQELLKRVKRALTAQTPDDWRFTRNPSAHFFISVVQELEHSGHKHTEQIKLLGGTCRVGPNSENLVGGIRKYAKAMVDPARSKPTLQSLEEMADLYLSELECPTSEIVHELKTCYSAREDIAQRTRLAERTFGELRHTILLQAMKTARMQGGMPNALLCEDSQAPGGLQLWVRQGDRWSSLDRGKKQAKWYALFCPLAQEGPVLDQGQIWSFDADGGLQREKEAAVSSVVGAKWDKPEGYRSETYWWLPTRLDFMAIDYDYLSREHAHLMSALEVATAQVISMVYDLAMAKLKLQPEPAWYRKHKK